MCDEVATVNRLQNHIIVIIIITRWLYCVECPQYSSRLEALGYLCHCEVGVFKDNV